MKTGLKGRTEIGKTLVWVLMGMLVIGLAGFGAVNFSGTARIIGEAGSQTITVNAYGRELQREMRSVEAQTGEPLTMNQARTMGLDQQVLGRLVTLASIDNEVAELGVSIGDENLQKEILAVPAFSGVDGKFDREAYSFALSQAGIKEAEFEADLRAEAARTLVQGAIVSGARMPEVLSDTITDFIAARRDFTVAWLDETALDAPIPAPTDDQLRTYYEANPEAFTLPETKRLAYVLLTPEMILDQVEVDETAIRDLYDQRSDTYDVPERRLVERLAFADEDAAAQAMAQIEVGGTTFEALVADRGLDLGDTDLGDVTLEDLGAAGDAVFAAEVGDVLGPLPSSLGPALFRVNGVLAARVTSFDEAEPELRDELAGDRARRLIETRSQDIDDLLAGGATLEELADETDMELGQIDWTPDSTDGIAAYGDFDTAAAAVTVDDFPAIEFLEDGSIFALRLDEVLPPRPEPFADARDRVAELWTAAQIDAALQAKADEVLAELEETGDFLETGLRVRVENGLTRTAFVEDAAPDFMAQVFEMTPGELRVIPGPGTVQIVRLDRELPPEETPELTQMKQTLDAQLNQNLGQALFEAYVRDARKRANPTIDQATLNAVLASFN